MTRSLARALLGIAISIAALVLVANGADLAAVGEALRSAAPALVAVLVLSTCIDLTCRGIRWRAILAPIKRVRISNALAYLLVGYLGNNILPARMGEVVRSHFAGDRERISRAAALGTIIVERLVDTTILALVAVTAVALLGIRGPVATAVVAGTVAALLLGGVILFVVVAHRVQVVMAIVARLPIGTRIAGLAGRLRVGLGVVRRPATLGRAVGWTVAAWAATIAGFVVAGLAIDVHLSWSQAALLASGVALSTAIPAGPGYIGTFELAGVQICQAMGIDPNHGLALTVLAHASALGVSSLGGAIALAWLASAARSANRTEPPSTEPPSTEPPSDGSPTRIQT